MTYNCLDSGISVILMTSVQSLNFMAIYWVHLQMKVYVYVFCLVYLCAFWKNISPAVSPPYRLMIMIKWCS